MRLGHTVLRILLLCEALLFIPGLPAWQPLVSSATQAYLLILGAFSCIAVVADLNGRPSARIWTWAVAITNLPVFPALTPVGLLVTVLLVTLESGDIAKLRIPGARSRWNGQVAWSGLVWLTGLVFCWLGASSVHSFTLHSGLPEAPAILLVGGLWLALPMCVAAHQAGHRLAGEIAGLEGVAAWSGWADPQPAATRESGLNGRLILWALGGPIASLLIGGALTVCLILSPGTFLAEVAELAGLTAVGSLAIFFISMAPWKAAGFRSDGALLLTVMRRGAAQRRERALALLTGQWLAGTRPRNWDLRQLRTVAAVADRSQQHATGCALNYMYCLDHDYDSSARYWIARLAEEFAQDRSTVPVRWRLEIAYYLAAYDTSARFADAEGWRRSSGRGQGSSPAALLRCEAALAIAKGQVEKAAPLIYAAERAALGDHDSCRSDFELDLLARLRDRFLVPSLPADARPATLVPIGEMSFGAV